MQRASRGCELLGVSHVGNTWKMKATHVHRKGPRSNKVGWSAQARASIATTSDAKTRRSGWSPAGGQRSPSGLDTIKERQNLSFVSVDNLPLSTDP